MINPALPPARHPAARPVPRPAWAEASVLHPDVDRTVEVAHTWTAPQAGLLLHGDGQSLPCSAQLCQDDELAVVNGQLQVRPGAPFVFLTTADVRITDTRDARALAMAILACCDRLDGAA